MGDQQEIKPLVSSIVAAERFGITNDYVSLLCRQKKVKGVFLERVWHVDEDSLAAFLSEMKKQQEVKRAALAEKLRQEYKQKAALRVVGAPQPVRQPVPTLVGEMDKEYKPGFLAPAFAAFTFFLLVGVVGYAAGGTFDPLLPAKQLRVMWQPLEEPAAKLPALAEKVVGEPLQQLASSVATTINKPLQLPRFTKTPRETARIFALELPNFDFKSQVAALSLAPIQNFFCEKLFVFCPAQEETFVATEIPVETSYVAEVVVQPTASASSYMQTVFAPTTNAAPTFATNNLVTSNALTVILGEFRKNLIDIIGNSVGGSIENITQNITSGATTLATLTDSSLASPEWGDLLYYNGSAWANIATSSLGIVGSGGGDPLWEENGSDIYYTAGNVGIGTTTPSTKLVINAGSTNTGSLIYQNGANVGDGLIGGFPALQVLAIQNSSIYYQLGFMSTTHGQVANYQNIGNTLAFDHYNTGGVYTGFNVFLPQGGLIFRDWVNGANNFQGIFAYTGDKLGIGGFTSSSAFSNPTAITPTILVDTNLRNVGIGTTSPFAKLSVAGGNLHVGGTITATSTATSTFSGPIRATCFSTDGTTCLTAGGSSLPFYASTTIGGGTQATGLTVSGGATTTGNLLVNGRGGFGDAVTSSNATRALNLISSDAVMRILRVSADIDTAGPAFELMHRTSANGTNTAYWDFFVNSNGFGIRDRGVGGEPTRLSINSSGNIGLGTTSPFAKLSIDTRAATTTPLAIRTTAYAGNYTPTSTGMFIYDWAGTEVLRIFASDPDTVNNFNSGNLYIGKQAGLNQLTNNTNAGYYNTGVGFESLYSNTIGIGNTAFGILSMRANVNGDNNTAIGVRTLEANTSGDQNTAVGEFALFTNTTGSNNSALGFGLAANITGSGNVAVGEYSSYNNASATSTTALGFEAGRGLGEVRYSNRGGVYVGYAAGRAAATGSDFNTFIGFQSGLSVSSGYSNIGLGASSTANITTGFGNIGIGYNTFFPSSTGNRQLNIGNLLYGSLPATSTSFLLPTSGVLGVASSSPYATLSVHANNGSTNMTLFAIGSSTALATTTLFSVNNQGNATLFGNLSVASCSGCGGGAAYPFFEVGNATSTLTQFNGGLTAYASTTIGSGTSTSLGGLTISGSATTTGTTTLLNSFVATGATGGVTISGAGTRMMWVPNKAAFRAGSVGDTGTQWDNSNIGLNSAAFGRNTTASGQGSFAMGYGNDNSQPGTLRIASTGWGSFAGGYAAKGAFSTGIIDSTGFGSFAFGYAPSGGSSSSILSIQATGNGSIAMGIADGNGTRSLQATNSASIALGLAELGNLTSTGKASVAIGQDVNATANNAFALGLGFTNNTASTFQVGFNSFPTLTVTSSNVGISTTSPFAPLSIHATSTNGVGAPRLLLAIASSTGGVSTSTIFAVSNRGGIAAGTSTSSTGSGSAAFGTSISSTGEGSLAHGFQVSASGVGAFAGGRRGQVGTCGSLFASGDGSFAFGYMAHQPTTCGSGGITSTNTGSIAMGYSSNGNVGQFTSSGVGSIALGVASGGALTSTGQASVAIGQSVNATANNAFALGKDFTNNTASTFQVGFNQWPTLTVTDSRVGIGTTTLGMFSILATSTTGLGSPTTLFAIASTSQGTATTTLFSILNTGNVGIGTTVPTTRLHLFGENDILMIESNNASLRSSIKFLTAGTDWEVGARGSSGGPDNSFYIYDNADGQFRLVIKPGGNVGLGTNDPNYRLDVLAGGTDIARFQGSSGTGCTLSNGGIIACSSDKTLKKNIEDLTEGLAALTGLRAVAFNWKTDSSTTTPTLGFIAQEVELVLPSLVKTDEKTGLKSLNQIGLIPVIVKAVQELYAMVTGFAERFTTRELCVEDVCVTRDQFLAMVQTAGQYEEFPEEPESVEEELVDEEPLPEETGEEPEQGGIEEVSEIIIPEFTVVEG